METHLKCRGCGKEYELGGYFGGCPDCASRGERGTLEVAYDYDAIASRLGPTFWGMAWDSLWQYAPLLPVADTGNIVSLGEGNTPLTLSRVVSEMLGLRYIFFKNESVSPTWSHKDRLHTVATSMAKVLNYSKSVASSTGNHGAAAAAYASAAGMDSVIFCPEETSKLLLDLISTLGARVLITDWEGRSAEGTGTPRSSSERITRVVPTPMELRVTRLSPSRCTASWATFPIGSSSLWRRGTPSTAPGRASGR